MKNLTSELVEEFRAKWGRFYYSDTVGMDWEKPEKVHKDMRAGILCLASDDMEKDMLTAFDRVRAEGRREAVEYVKLRSTPKKDGKGKVLGYETYAPIFEQAASVDKPS